MRGVPERTVARWVITAAYLLTPLFAWVDFGLGHNLRAPGLDALDAGLGWRIAFYAGATALGLLAVWVPVVAGPAGVAEAGANVGVTCLAVMLPYRDLLESARAGGEVAMPPFPLAAVLVTAAIASIGVAASRGKRHSLSRK